VIGRVLAALLAGVLVAGGTGVGLGEPRPQLVPADRLSHGAAAAEPLEHAIPVKPLGGADALSSAPRAIPGALPVSSVGRDVTASPPARAASPHHADALSPAGEASEPRIKP
jgi:hypothetical protein